MKSIPDSTPFLFVDDDKGLLFSVKMALVSAGLSEPALISDGTQAIDVIRNADGQFKVIMIDLIMPDINGLDLLEQIKTEFPDIECIVVTAVDDVTTAVKAIQLGAYDYLVKPLETEKMCIVLANALEKYNLRKGLSLFETKPTFADLKFPKAFEGVIARDEKMARVFHQVETVAPTDYNVMITGESGTGKELIAQILHKLSQRSQNPFLAVNMAAHSATLFSSEFFGHTDHAFTGAKQEKKGFFEAAHQGTIFLDEISDLEIANQSKLLRVLETGELYRLGSTKTFQTDIRVICATNRDIRKEISKGQFRNDLFHRLNRFHIHIPALRDRKDDIVPLANYFLKKHRLKTNKKVKNLHPDLINCLKAYPFPGNIRELENIISQGVLMEKSTDLSINAVTHLLMDFDLQIGQTAELAPLLQVESAHILKVLDATQGNKTQAAKILGIGLRTLQRKLKIIESA